METTKQFSIAFARFQLVNWSNELRCRKWYYRFRETMPSYPRLRMKKKTPLKHYCAIALIMQLKISWALLTTANEIIPASIIISLSLERLWCQQIAAEWKNDHSFIKSIRGMIFILGIALHDRYRLYIISVQWCFMNHSSCGLARSLSVRERNVLKLKKKNK